VRILILGASDSEGTLLPNFADSWREILRTELPPLIGEPVEIHHRRYYVHLPGTFDFLERCIREADPDFAILPCTGYAFSAPSVGHRLRRLLGKRTGDWIERRFTSFDAATTGTEGTLRDRVNSAAHSIAAHTVGRESLSTYERVLGDYIRTAERLAQIEDLDMVVMGTTYNGPAIQRRLPKSRLAVDRFNGALRDFAASRHFGWVDRQALISPLPLDIERPDQMHAGATIHRAYADALIPLIVASVKARA